MSLVFRQRSGSGKTNTPPGADQGAKITAAFVCRVRIRIRKPGGSISGRILPRRQYELVAGQGIFYHCCENGDLISFFTQNDSEMPCFAFVQYEITRRPRCAFLLPSRLSLSVPDLHRVNRHPALCANRILAHGLTGGRFLRNARSPGTPDHRRWGLPPRPEGKRLYFLSENANL